MRAIRIAITHTEATIHPIHSLICTTDGLSRERILYITVADGVETTINYVEGEPEVYETALRRKTVVDEYEVYPDGSDGCYSYIRNELGAYNSALATALQRETLAVIPPIEYLPDRRMLVSLVVTERDFRDILEEIPDELTVDVIGVGSIPQIPRSQLTAKQRRAMRTAWENGYYEIPRTATLEEVAAELDCSVSTASDLLRRGQASLVATALGVDDSVQ
ncbi:helix-turn-helix domain-containing protein [Natronolimnohabitans innermongolicus]|uniref:Bacterio-opsin activator HTH domain-containing protein n=1 Tax=Natronolimnohabitans innermongolicus JCM 12255 TaxID=1227499 RepID=L9XH96_9EURY|nr:helix-turn-helix domain-containing protein [Natronolimnohabitans innermongolicus]ELY60796.1 bacterio-opsin activator HTH domain-containing protein [Natronolimnohabitans innermongolicus JCM 12255]